MLLVFSYAFPITNIATENGSIRYESHLQDYGWISTKYDGQTSGTTGESRRMEAIAIALSGVDGNFSYQVHCEAYGWLGKVPEGHIAGTTGESKRLEAIIINLDNSSYSIKYRVHVQDYGWMNWVSSGQVAGTTGESRRIEAIEIKIERKNNVINNGSTSNNENISNTESKKEHTFGIDVSKYQGNIDWSKVKNSGVEFAMIRCAYRGYTAGTLNEDEKFITNVKGAYNNGIKVGLYFYSSAITEEEAIEEANYVLGLIEKYGIKNNITYPIAFDIEDFEGTRNYVLSVQERTNITKVFCETIKNAGFKPMVYSYTYFLSTKLDMSQLKNYDTWIADYYGNTWYTGEYKMWQYTSSGQIDGIVGNVDLNYGYYDL
jgi:GH25 family lysozyme M1 (1,4-beta-N-acetylmuramidase)